MALAGLKLIKSKLWNRSVYRLGTSVMLDKTSAKPVSNLVGLTYPKKSSNIFVSKRNAACGNCESQSKKKSKCKKKKTECFKPACLMEEPPKPVCPSPPRPPQPEHCKTKFDFKKSKACDKPCPSRDDTTCEERKPCEQ